MLYSFYVLESSFAILDGSNPYGPHYDSTYYMRSNLTKEISLDLISLSDDTLRVESLFEFVDNDFLKFGISKNIKDLEVVAFIPLEEELRIKDSLENFYSLLKETSRQFIELMVQEYRTYSQDFSLGYVSFEFLE